MKSLAGNVGNINLRGKRFKALRCGCCVVEDLRCREDAKQAQRMIRAALRGYEDDGYTRADDQW